MTYTIEKAAVIGAGTMGAAIAAHLANAGVPTLLLDIAPAELSEGEQKKGLALSSPAVRNRIVREGFERIRKINPASFMSKEAESRVTLGNLEDDLGRLGEVDWIVEAVVENLAVKRQLMERIDGVRKPGSILTTNTSGLPINRIAEGRSEDFRRHFFGTHFFNPPRYMKLLEVIAGDEADSAAVAAIAEFAADRLGKGVVYCKDTPNFIGNRLISVHGSFTMNQALERGLRFEEADAITGPLIGRPKTATFRLQDLVGIDIAWHVAQNLRDLIPDDPFRGELRNEKTAKLVEGLLAAGAKGNKTGAGFYRKGKDAAGKTVFEVLRPALFASKAQAYEPQEEPDFALVAETAKIKDLGKRLQAILDDKWQDDRAGGYLRALIGHFLSYASAVAREIAFDLPSIDNAVRWGFSYEVGPFELWDLVGVEAMAARMKADGLFVASWVEEMLAAGCPSFYQRSGDKAVAAYDWDSKSYRPIPEEDGVLRVADLRAAGKVVRANKSASLLDAEDGVLLLEFHSKMNAIDDGVVEMMEAALEELEDDRWFGLVIGNDGANFCVGANLMGVGMLAQQGDFAGIAEASRRFQMAILNLRRFRKPVVAAVHGMALGGGAEILLGADRVVIAAESYVGLVEVGVGLLPAGGGLKELVRRHVNPAVALPEGDPLPALGKILETVAMAKTSTSAAEAGELGFLASHDRIVMNRDFLLSEACQEVLTLVADGYLPPPPAQLYAGGRDLLAALKMAVWSLQQAGWASGHDALIAGKIAGILAGGDGSSPARLSEEHFLRLEREGFVELVQTEKTQARMKFMLENGKPLRN
jgi:3-hydroxyacyl-CoA dehydrogenase